MTIPEAAGVLGITGKESLNGIHARFHALIKEWHPDVSQHDPTFPISCSSA
jgi:DnaJ-class molecular chaperone